jgi:hypothetical protein
MIDSTSQNYPYLKSIPFPTSILFKSGAFAFQINLNLKNPSRIGNLKGEERSFLDLSPHREADLLGWGALYTKINYSSHKYFD